MDTYEEHTVLPLNSITIFLGNRDTAARFVSAMKETFGSGFPWTMIIEQEKYADWFALTVIGMSLEDTETLLSLHQRVVT